MGRKRKLERKLARVKQAVFRDMERISLVVIHRTNSGGAEETAMMSPVVDPNWDEAGQSVLQAWVREARRGIAPYPDTLTVCMTWRHRADNELVLRNFATLLRQDPDETLLYFCTVILIERICDEEVFVPTNGTRLPTRWL